MGLTEARVREIYEDFVRARFDQLAEAFDENVDFLSHAPTDYFPYLGRRRGRDAVLAAFSEIRNSLEVVSFWPLTVLVEGEDAALTVSIDVRERSRGRSARFLAAHFLRFKNGRVVQFCGIVDSLDAARQLGTT